MVAPNRGWQFTAVITTAAAAVIKAAGGKGTRHYIKALQFQNTSGTATQVNIRNGAALAWQGQAAASMTVPTIVIFEPPIASDDNALLDVIALTAGANLLFNVQGISGA